jgi:hypothetical protein
MPRLQGDDQVARIVTHFFEAQSEPHEDWVSDEFHFDGALWPEIPDFKDDLLAGQPFCQECRDADSDGS